MQQPNQQNQIPSVPKLANSYGNTQQAPQQFIPQMQAPVNYSFNVQQQYLQPSFAQQFQASSNVQVMPPQMQYMQQAPVYNFDQGVYGDVQELKLLKPRDKNKKIAAIIVSFANGSSYDALFRTVQQKTMEGTQVLVYAAPSIAISNIHKGFIGQQCGEAVKDLLSNIKEVHPDCVVFNWQCSSSYSGQTFTEGRETVIKLLKIILDAGHMAMFSDFSLKALIQEWDQAVLGSNPFVRTGQTSSEVTLHFKPAVLKECPSAQLQIVGDMAEGDHVNLHTLGGTILYSVDPHKIDKSAYELSVLTINSTNPPVQAQYTLDINGKKGSAGHVLLKYKSGGLLLTSMGHWVELMKIDTSEKKLFEIAEREYGQAYAQQMKMEYASMDVTAQKSYIRSQAVNFVQNQAPCSNMNQKGFY